MVEEKESLNKKTKLFEGQKVRTHWDGDVEKWYFSIVDVVAVLTDSDYQTARKYWNKLAQRMREEGNESVTKCHQLKLKSSDGKSYLTDVGDTEQVLRLVQSIPSKKAEPFKLWLAKIGNERIDETHNPELAIDRAMKTYLRKGYSKEWINQRLKTIEVRKELTDEWERVGVGNEQEFAILTDEITKAWSDLSVKEYKKLKNLKKESLRDNMSNVELVLNMLAEVTTKEISKKENPSGFFESVVVAKKGGEIAGNARKELEEKIGESIISGENFLDNLEKIKKKKKKIEYLSS
jgi:hypothetical protein